MADNLNTAKTYFDLTDCWHETINAPKHSSLVWAITTEWTDKENSIAVIALRKCRIESAHIFELLKLLNNVKINIETVKYYMYFCVSCC